MKVVLDNMVDVCVGQMTAKQLSDNLYHYTYLYHPRKIAIITNFGDNEKEKYHSEIYIDIASFKKGVNKDIQKIYGDRN